MQDTNQMQDRSSLQARYNLDVRQMQGYRIQFTRLVMNIVMKEKAKNKKKSDPNEHPGPHELAHGQVQISEANMPPIHLSSLRKAA